MHLDDGDDDAAYHRFMDEPLECIKYGTPSKGYGCPPKTEDTLQQYLDSHTPEQLRAELDKRKHLQMVLVNGKLVPIDTLSWWRKDKHGWPIETVKGRPFKNFCRLMCQNIRKLGI